MAHDQDLCGPLSGLIFLGTVETPAPAPDLLFPQLVVQDGLRTVPAEGSLLEPLAQPPAGVKTVQGLGPGLLHLHVDPRRPVQEMDARRGVVDVPAAGTSRADETFFEVRLPQPARLHPGAQFRLFLRCDAETGHRVWSPDLFRERPGMRRASDAGVP